MITTEPQTLWHAWRDRADQKAFAELVRPEIRYAADLARRAGASRTEADDVVQEALVKLANEASDTPVEVGIRAWICRRVVLGVKMHIRSSVRRRKHERRAPPARAGDRPGAGLERRDQVEVALAKLEESERRAIVLRFLHDLEYREMAYILGISQNACRIRVHRALKRMRELVGQRAAAMVAMLVIPPVLQEGAFIAGATTALGAGATAGTAAAASAGSGAAAATTGTGATATAAGAAIGTKTVVATGTSLVAAAAITVGVVASKQEEPPPPPPVVAEAPAPEPPPPLLVDPAPKPAPPTQPVRLKPPSMVFLEDHYAGRKDGTAVMSSLAAIKRVIGTPLGETVKVKTTGPVTYVDLYALAREYDRIVLDTGVFRVMAPLHPWGDRGVVEIVGQGRDETFLLSPVRDTVMARPGRYLAGLIVRDLTFDGNLAGDRYCAGILDVRGTAAALFERVHFKTWADAGFGAPVGIWPEASALLAFKDCRFTGAVRRRPHGSAITVRGRALYRFEDCQFSDLPNVIGHPRRPKATSRSLGILENCVFDNSALVDSVWANETMPPQYPILVRGGRVLIGWNEHERGDRLNLWRARGATSVRGLTFENEPVRCTLRDMRKVLEGYDPPRGKYVVRIRVYTWRGCEEPGYAIYLAHPRGDIEVRLAHLRDGKVVEGWSGGFDIDPRLHERPWRGTTLLQLLEKNWDEMDLDRPVGILDLMDDTGDTPLIEVRDRMRRWRKIYR